MNGATEPQSGGGEHTNWLPSLNLRFGLTDDQFIRFAVSRALARPDMGLYKNYIAVARRRSGLRRRYGHVRSRRAIATATRWRTTPQIHGTGR